MAASGIMFLHFPENGKITRAPFLVFSPKEIAQLRCVLGQSNWACAATHKMREYLDDPDVIRYLERENV